MMQSNSRTEQIQNCTNLTNNQNKQNNSAKRKISEASKLSQAGVTFRHSDMFSNFPETEQFDVIVSQPPYIPSAVIEELEPEVRDHEPREPLTGPADGLFLQNSGRRMYLKHLTPGGYVYFEIGYDQGAAVKELLDIHGFKDTRVIQDLTGKDRAVCGTWQTAGV